MSFLKNKRNLMRLFAGGGSLILASYGVYYYKFERPWETFAQDSKPLMRKSIQFRNQGKIKESIDYAEIAVRSSEKQKGKTSLSTTLLRNELADLYARGNRLEDAARELTYCWMSFRELNQVDRALSVSNQLADLLMKLKHWQEAERLLVWSRRILKADGNKSVVFPDESQRQSQGQSQGQNPNMEVLGNSNDEFRRKVEQDILRQTERGETETSHRESTDQNISLSQVEEGFVLVEMEKEALVNKVDEKINNENIIQWSERERKEKLGPLTEQLAQLYHFQRQFSKAYSLYDEALQLVQEDKKMKSIEKTCHISNLMNNLADTAESSRQSLSWSQKALKISSSGCLDMIPSSYFNLARFSESSEERKKYLKLAKEKADQDLLDEIRSYEKTN